MQTMDADKEMRRAGIKLEEEESENFHPLESLFAFVSFILSLFLNLSISVTLCLPLISPLSLPLSVLTHSPSPVLCNNGIKNDLHSCL